MEKKPETERQKLERELQDMQRKKYELEEADRKRRTIAKLYMLPEGWEEKVAAAAVESLKSGSEHISLELVEFSMDTKRSVRVGIRTDLFAYDYTEDEKKTPLDRLRDLVDDQ